ncbi:alpha/beta fold hydrolase [Streptomyces sp. NBC_00847]|uniref:alpha/beta fold hydrolase n=1 Tax=Streptomyces sp. NBC_00847 TaxID=2975850 RepID=UPI0033906F63
MTPRLRADGHHVVRYDARGHSESTRRPADVSRAACVRDALALIEEPSLAPVTLIGQSLGGHTAMLLAAAHPDLVRSLILVEAGPAGPSPNLPFLIESWLHDWHPLDRAVMVASISELATNDYWREWSAVRAPPSSSRARTAPCARPSPPTCWPAARAPPTTRSSRTRATTCTWTSRSTCTRR